MATSDSTTPPSDDLQRYPGPARVPGGDLAPIGLDVDSLEGRVEELRDGCCAREHCAGAGRVVHRGDDLWS